MLTISAPGLGAEELRIVPASPEENSPQEPLRQRLFGEQVKTPGCLAVDTGPKGALLKTGTDLDAFVKKFLVNLQRNDATELAKLFHARLNIRPITVETQLFGMGRQYGEPVDFSIQRLWALNTVDGATKALPCDPDISVFPLYGYPLQFGLWVQVMGKNDLGRLYIGIVPAAGKWNIGAFHSQQWTHNGRDFQSWAEEAAHDAAARLPEAAFAKFDIATKLASGGGFVKILGAEQAATMRDQQMSLEKWQATIKQSAKDLPIVHVATMLADGGVGILVRIQANGDLPLKEIERICKGVGADLALKTWTKRLAGIRCSFVLRREDPTKEGILGGIYYPFADLRKSLSSPEAAAATKP